MKKISFMLLLIAAAVCVLALPASAETIEGWAADSPAMAPVLVFGNSSGDFAMAQYALQHGGKAYMLL